MLRNLLRPLRDHSITSSASAIYETRLHWVFTAVKTMGIEVVAAIAARAVTTPPDAAITSTWRCTNSAPSAGNWLNLPRAQRYSTTTFDPQHSRHRSSPGETRRRRARNRQAIGRHAERPTVGFLSSARAASGHVTVPPISA